MNSVSSLSEKLNRKREELKAEGKLNLADKNKVEVPDTPPSVSFMKENRDSELDAVLDDLDIAQAYNMYAGKGEVPSSSKTEGVKVRCPNPSHADRNPSAWLNTDKQTWYCAACEQGGDKFDMAAWHFGMPVPGYKTGKNFPELKARIASSLGYTVSMSAGSTYLTKDEDTEEDDETEDEALAEVHDIFEHERFDHDEDIELDWRSVVEKGTFLDAYMQQAIVDDAPEEYHLWNGLLATALAVGKDVTLRDLYPVHANLFICILGRTGSGKSKSKGTLDKILDAALPYSHTDPNDKGVLRTPAPASAEALIGVFQKKISEGDEDSDEVKTKTVPVRGIVEYSELSSLISRTNRLGNALIPTLMQFYDSEDTVSTVSRGHGVTQAKDPFACVVTTSQPKSLKNLLTIGDATSGFLNRWVFVLGKEKKRIAVGGTPVDVHPAVKPLQEIHAWAGERGTRQIDWTQDALDRFTKLFDETIYPVIQKDESALLSRLDLLCKKLILLFAINSKTLKVEERHIAQVEKMLPYILQAYGVPMTQIGMSEGKEAEYFILKAIVNYTKRKKQPPSWRDINQLIKHKKFPTDLLRRVVENLVKLDFIREEYMVPASGLGRPAKRYVIDDIKDTEKLITVTHKEITETEKEG